MSVAQAAGIGGALFFAQLVLVLWTSRRLRELAHIRERMSRLADGLALLTDTTEAGLATIAREVEQLGAPQGAAARRIARDRLEARRRRGPRRRRRLADRRDRVTVRE